MPRNPKHKKQHSLPHPLSDIEVEEAIKSRVGRINAEFTKAFELLKDYPRSVTILGSARFKENNPYCIKARSLTKRIVSEIGYTIFTGGGGGIMEASNRGAMDGKGQSVGLNINLPNEQKENRYTTESIDFNYFFSRKLALTFDAEACVFFPGGYGTLNELFEILTLVQTHKVPRVPMILVGKEFWEPLHNYIFSKLFTEHSTIDHDNMNLYTITDSEDEIINIIKKAPLRNGIRFHD
jgi:uncharacterized protein (TIGR00730 family)